MTNPPSGHPVFRSDCLICGRAYDAKANPKYQQEQYGWVHTACVEERFQALMSTVNVDEPNEGEQL